MKLFALLICATFSTGLLADTGALLDEAASLKAGDAKGWTVIRESVLEQGESALPALLAAGASENWTREGWQRAMAANALRLRIEKPEWAAVCDNPEGIQPAVYKQFKRARPFCVRDLENLGKDATPLLLEQWFFLLETREFTPGEAGKLERDALAHGLLYVPGFHADARARFAMQSALTGKALPDAWRQTAAVSFAQCGGAEALEPLCAFFDDAANALLVREACGWAIGHIPSLEAANALKARLSDEAVIAGADGGNLRRGLLTGVSNLGSSWSWKSRGTEKADLALQVRQACAEIAIQALRDMPAEVELISRALNMTAWKSSVATVSELATDTNATAETRAAATKCLETLADAVKNG